MPIFYFFILTKLALKYKPKCQRITRHRAPSQSWVSKHLEGGQKRSSLCQASEWWSSTEMIINRALIKELHLSPLVYISHTPNIKHTPTYIRDYTVKRPVFWSWTCSFDLFCCPFPLYIHWFMYFKITQTQVLKPPSSFCSLSGLPLILHWLYLLSDASLRQLDHSPHTWPLKHQRPHHSLGVTLWVCFAVMVLPQWASLL